MKPVISKKFILPADSGFKRFKKIVCYLTIFSLFIQLMLPALAYPLEIKSGFSRRQLAAAAEEFIFRLTGAEAAQAYDTVFDPIHTAATIKQTGVTVKAIRIDTAADVARDEKNEAKHDAEISLKDAVFTAMKQSLNYMLNTMAFDVATWLASGGEGQQPMFFTEGWGEYLTNIVDNAAGNFLEKVGGSWLGFDICDPSNLNLKISIGIAIADTQRPPTPRCSVTQMLNNWESLINDRNIFNRLNLVFDPDKNDIGIALTIFNKQYEALTEDLDAKTKDREETSGFKGVLGKISNFIKTPGTIVNARAASLSEEAQVAEWNKVQYGSILQDAIGTFVNTLAGKIFQRLFKEGLAALQGGQEDEKAKNNLSPLNLSNLFRREASDLYTGETGVQGYAGVDTAASRFSDFLKAGIKNEGPYDVLSKLAFCPDAANPGPDECAIKPEFRTAIEREITLKQAIEEKFIDGGAPFGFAGYDTGAIYRGLPLRSILILRAFRVVPVSWEIAAQIINNYEAGRVWSLNDLIAQYDNEDSNFYHLIDKNWVLKLPDHYCKAEGYGEKLVSDTVSGDVRVINRATYCADYQSCIEEKPDGSCRYYGYCTEEKRIWKFTDAIACPDYYNTCQTFQDPAGQAVSYLQNSLDFNGCNADNAGCRWFCQDYNVIDNIWTCTAAGQKVLSPCAEASGCTLTARCDVTKDQTSCFDSTHLVDLTMGRPCDETSKWWNSGSGSCAVDTTCTVVLGGVTCSETGCAGLTNFLPNGSFEEVELAKVAKGWTADVNYFRQSSGGGEPHYDGKTTVRFFNVGGAIANNTLISGNLTNLSPTKSYTFTGRVFNKLNSGSLKIAIMDTTGASPVLLEERQIAAAIKDSWQEVSFDFTAAAKVKVYVTILNNAVGTAWLDDFRVTEACLANPVRLALVGDTDKADSKVHLNGQASECSAESAGCSQLIRLEPNAGVNLVANGSFETWPGEQVMPPGFKVGESHGAAWTDGTSLARVSDGAQGLNSIRLLNGSNKARDFETLPLLGVKPNASYRVSFWAKSDSAILPSDQLWYAAITSVHVPDKYCSIKTSIDCATAACPADAGVCVDDEQKLIYNGSEYLNLTDGWQRFAFDVITTRSAGANFKVAFINKTGNTAIDKGIYLDGLQVEQVSDLGFGSYYQEYGTANLAYITKAPASLGCQGYTINRPSPDLFSNITTEEDCAGDAATWFNGACHRIDPPACFSYAPYCFADEVGCEGYDLIGADDTVPTIPAVVAYDDYCPAECVGYDSYYQSKTYLESTETMEYFIPATARLCNASQAGCDEFTNLDEAAAGGEARQYYQYLRLCRKPGESGANCQSFYTWQGSDETGYQLKAYSFSAEADGQPVPSIEPTRVGGVITNWNNLPDYWCSNKALETGATGDNADQPACCNSADDLVTNPFCREFYATNGKIYYRLYPNTISCSDNCHPYRKTRLGGTDTVEEQNCVNSHGRWDAANKYCVYEAIPSEGISCPAAAAGCREYRGNASGNIFVAYSDNFESGTIRGWQYGTISSESLSVGGHSVKSQTTGTVQAVMTMRGKLGGVSGTKTCSDTDFPACGGAVTFDCFDTNQLKCVAKDFVTTDTCTVEVGQQYCGTVGSVMRAGKSYIVYFSAKAPAGNLSISLKINYYDSGSEIDLGKIIAGSEWGYYSYGPFTINQANPSGQLRFIGPNNTAIFNLDNVSIKEVDNYLYAIRNSWTTPLSCDTNPFLNPAQAAPRFMLGCKAYADTIGRVHNLKSFNHLCREEAVGCQEMIDTKNSASPFAQTFNQGDVVDGTDFSVTVPADSLTYVVSRPEFQCPAEDKGCAALGLPSMYYGGLTPKVSGYETVFKINDPDRYQNILCKHSEVGCDVFQTGNGYSYFKDPAGATCERRLIGGSQGEYGWYKLAGTSTTTPDCPLVEAPVGVNHPGNGYVGLCDNQNSGCNLFIDSPSNIGKNIVFNSDLRKEIVGQPPFGWDKPAELSNKGLAQDVTLNAGTEYTLSFTSKVSLKDATKLYVEIRNCEDLISYDNSLIQSPANKKVFYLVQSAYTSDSRTYDGLSNVERQYSGRFKTVSSAECQLALVYDESGGASTVLNKINSVTIKETGLYYYLENSVDKLSCNGLVNPEQGCVLFNDRSAINYYGGETDTTYLKFDTNISGNNAKGEPINNNLAIADCSGVCDANAVIKVKPDRACQTWVYPSSLGTYTDDKGALKTYSINLGLCDSMDENGNCASPLVFKSGTSRNDQFNSPDDFKNLSGYSTAGFNNTSTDADIRGEFPYVEMTQDGGNAVVTNGSFEAVFGDTVQPIGWNDPSGWEDFKFQVISDGKKSVDGYGYLQLNTYYQAVSEYIDLEPGQKYQISGWINTQSLQHPLKISSTYAGLCITENDDPGCRAIDMEVKVLAGQTWQRFSYEYAAGLTTTKIKLVLSNFADDIGGCIDEIDGEPNETTSCNISGFSLFDDITIKPVLSARFTDNVRKSNGTVKNSATDFVGRSCRMYPTAGSLSCLLTEGNSQVTGQYGYCVLPDPFNPKQCLQWWPVDQIKGDEPQDVVGGYRDRAPLYYCTEKNLEVVKLQEGGAIARVSAQAENTEYAGLRDLDSGNEIKTIPFDIPEEYRIFFREPYVQVINFDGGFIGVGAQNGFGAAGITADMYKSKSCPMVFGIAGGGGKFVGPIVGGGCTMYDGDPEIPPACAGGWHLGCIIEQILSFLGGLGTNVINLVDDFLGALLGINLSDELLTNDEDVWGGFALECIGIQGFGIFCLTIPWHVGNVTTGDTSGILSQLAPFLEDVLGMALLQATTIGVKIVTDQDTQLAGQFNDPYPDIPGDILGAAWFNNSTGDKNVYGTALFGSFSAEFYAPYCSQMVEVVTSAGGTKAWNNRVFAGSGYIQQETINDYPYYENNIWVRDVSYFYDKPFSWDDFIASREDIVTGKYSYVSSDYKPYGGLVQPANGQYPDKWDSRTEIAYKQPLFFEWPRNEAFDPPYQARAGQLHNMADLKHLFLKSNTVWQWSDNGTEKKYDDAYIPETGATIGWDLLVSWESETNKGYCNGIGSERPAVPPADKELELCRVRPRITNIFVNDMRDEANKVTHATTTEIVRNGTVKLAFNVIVDPNQLPLRVYDIDWGDGNHTDIAGATLLDRPHIDHPFIFYHNYDYWLLYRLEQITPEPDGYDCNADYCTVKIKIKIKDNWNAYSFDSLSGFGVEDPTKPEKRYHSMDGKLIIYKK